MEFKTGEWERVKALFQAALDLEPSARLRFLDKEGGTTELRNTVEALLAAHDEGSSPLDDNPAMPLSAFLAPAQEHLAPGMLLADRFRIVRFIAGGGMGQVYEAEDLELQTRVALKSIRPEIANLPQALARFKREVHLARQVTHTNVCRIFDLFRHRDSVNAGNEIVFVSMELLNGETLSEKLKRGGRMSTEEVAPILHQIVSGLGAAHTAGILHRDLKPSNIVLEQEKDGAIRAVITDFGLAWSRESNSENSLAGGDGFAFGTPEYMSPEQIEGKALTPASDIYSLGLVIYQMVTGMKAFGADSPLFATLRRMNEPPPLPSQAIPEIGTRWDFLVSRCLCPAPARRFASAAQLLEVIETPSPTMPAAIHPVDMPAVRHQPALQWQWVVAAALTVAIAVVAGILFHERWHKSELSSMTYVLADFVNTTGEPMFDNTLNLALGAKLQQTPYLERLPDAKIRTGLAFLGLAANQRLTENVAIQVCQRLAGTAVLQGTIENGSQNYIVTLRAEDCHTGKVLATQKIEAEHQESVLHALDRAADGIRPALGESLTSIHRYGVPLWQATTPSMEALVAFTQGNTEWNAKGEIAALSHFQKAVSLDPNFALAWARMGTVYGNIGETQKSCDALGHAYELRDRVTEWERYYIVSHYYAFATGEIDKEMQTYEDWAAAYPHDMAWTINLGVDYGIVGNYDKAIELQRRAIREAPGNAPSYGNLAQLYLVVDRPDESRAILDEAAGLHLSDANIELAEYALAFYSGDAARMKSVAASVAHRPGIDDMLLSQQAASEDREGRLSSAREFSVKAFESARQSGDNEVSASWLALEAERQAQLQDDAGARRLIEQALAVPRAAQAQNVQVLVGLASAATGNLDRARKILSEVSRAHPLDSIVQHYWVLILRARIALAEKRPEAAVAALKGTEIYDLGVFTPGQCMDAAYLRGEALLSAHQASAASVEFRNVLAHRGLILNCPTGALSQLGLARALALSGDTSGSRIAYQDLFALWKDADKDFRPVRQAQAEYRALR